MTQVSNAFGSPLFPIPARGGRTHSRSFKLRECRIHTAVVPSSSSMSPRGWWLQRYTKFVYTPRAQKRDDSSADTRDDIWSRRSLSSLEKELLGVDPADAKDAPPHERNTGRTSRSSPPPPRRKANGEEWSIFDEMESRLPTNLLGLTEAPAVQKLVKVGEWLEQKTIPDTKEAQETPAYGALTILGFFPIWLFLVLISTGVIHLPPQLQAVEDFFTYVPHYVPKTTSSQPLQI